MRYEVHRSLRTPVGVLRVTACERGVVAIDRVARATTSKQSHASRATSATVDASKLVRAQRHADVAVRQLREYFAGTRTRFSVPLHMEGTAFQKRAWRTMRK
ncbi:MAG: methylated-DNA--[protein]-cysteine S-methyltransferase, partial [Ilumatobacteraceae bacterium]